MDVGTIVERIAAGMGDRAVFVGGVAVECYAPYRRTHDVDVVVRERDFAALKSLLVGEGFAHRRPTHLEKHAFKARDGGEVDAYTSRIGDVPVDEGLFRRSRRVPFGGTRVRAASPEDLVRLKLSAGREMDLADVAVLLCEKSAEFDGKGLESLVGLDRLRAAAGRLPDSLPEEYGWLIGPLLSPTSRRGLRRRANEPSRPELPEEEFEELLSTGRHVAQPEPGLRSVVQPKQDACVPILVRDPRSLDHIAQRNLPCPARRRPANRKGEMQDSLPHIEVSRPGHQIRARENPD